MKKITLTITISALILLAGCGKTTAPGTVTESADISVQNTKEENTSSADNDFIFIESGYNTYETGFITNTDPQMYLDFKTMEKTVLCSKPNCTHKSSDCPARIVGETPIIYNDYIYFFSSTNGVNETPDGREFYINSKLNRISLTSSEIEEVAHFTDCDPTTEERYLILNDVLYFCGTDLAPTVDDYGNINSGSSGGTHFICSIDLSTGEYTNYGSIYDGDKQYEYAHNSSSAKVIGYYDSRIFIEYSFMKEEISIEEMEEKDARDYFTILNFEFDPATKTLSESELPPPAYMDGDTYVYSNYPENSSTVIDKGETYTFDGIDVEYGRVFNGKLFVGDCWYDITDGSKHSLGKYTFGEDDYWEVIAFYDNCYIFMGENRNSFVKFTEEELLALKDET